MIDLSADQLAQVRDIVRQHVHGGEVFAFGSRVSGRAKRVRRTTGRKTRLRTTGCHARSGRQDAYL